MTDTQPARDQELFDAIGKGKKRRKIRRIVVLLVILALVAGGITAAVIYGKRKVREQMGSMPSTSAVNSYTVDTGSVNTTVSGSGQLADVGEEKLTLPNGVKAEEILVSVGEQVHKGDLLAIVDRSSVITAMSTVQNSITELDGKLRTAASDAVSANITAGVPGRVKAIYAQPGDDVAAVMSAHGALALVSMDGYMAVEIPAGTLEKGQSVTVQRSTLDAKGNPNKDLTGTVDLVSGDSAVVLITDNGPLLDEDVTVLSADGAQLGSGKLYIHNPLRITGYAGTVSAVQAKENAQVYAATALFRLKDTSFSVNYDAYLKERHSLEEDLLELIEISRAGAVRAPFDGTVSSVDFKDPNAPSDKDSSESDESDYGDYSDYDDYGDYDDGSGGSGSGSGSKTDKNTGALVTLAPDREMSLTIHVDETDILALQLGQTAQVTINSIGEMFTGTVTEINRSSSGSAGVTSYSAVITMPKDPRMMSGMSAKAVVRIQGVAGAILIPMEALHQSRDAAFVYTTYNEETKEFGGAVSVTPGLSDGAMVEIVEGLSEGDTVYYTVQIDPWAMYMASSGNASAGDAWVEYDETGEEEFDEEFDEEDFDEEDFDEEDFDEEEFDGDEGRG